MNPGETWVTVVPMLRRFGRFLKAHQDAALASGLAVLAQAEIWSAELDLEDKVAIAPLGAIATVALIWRRRVPLAVVLVAGVSVFASSVIVPPSSEDPIAPALAMAVGLYSVGAYTEGRSATAGGLLTLALVFSAVAQDPDAASAGSFLFFALVVGGPRAAGRAIRRRRASEHRLEHRAVTAEREREARAREAVAEERSRIARELHDVVAHAISVIVVQARGGRRSLESEPDEARGSFDAIEETGRQALTEMRRLLGMLRASDEEISLAPQPSLANLEDLLGQVRKTGLPVELSVEGKPRVLPPGVDLSAYRIVQEALTNALKHAGPARARVVLRYGTEDLELEIVDDGSGVGSEGNGGHGLAGMRERVTVFGGELSAGPRPEGGYALRARLPLASARP